MTDEFERCEGEDCEEEGEYEFYYHEDDDEIFYLCEKHAIEWASDDISYVMSRMVHEN